MSLAVRISQLAQAIATDIKTLLAGQGNLAALTTVQKGSVVAAINELKQSVEAAQAAAGAQIADTASDVEHTWSAAKIIAQLNQIKSDIVNGAPAAYDTLVEVATKLASDDGAIAGLLTAVGNRVSFADAQTLTAQQQAQACANIGVGDPETDFVTAYTTAKA